ncbi:PLP-dependent aminotransferase family protein [Vibrio aquaticus]|uniref:PLP-dependent aminotransferase family protein n=1 Tax=Vibrio aquaticus TaxID=2496559 RepID=A0A432CXM5_9VIBR|nr:PLP-dependent aminotransferase family protein [Vibrio aquaticus]RTZ16665.1 PLP-dependent aminotransferase family protein [Vibrio aquaticus]
MNRYQTLADDIKQQILSNTWRSGEKIPSVRKASQNYAVSAATVLQAYQLLESEGWLVAKPQSGYFVTPRMDRVEVAEQPTIRPAYNDELYEFLQVNMKADTAFGSALPDPSLFPFDSLTRHLASAGRKMSSQSIIQDMPPGNEDLRRLIAQRYLNQGVNVTADDIVITSGAMEGLNLSLQVSTSPQETIAIEAPAFYGALQAAKRLQLSVVPVAIEPLNGIDLVALEKAFQQGARASWLMPNFQNPTGTTLTDTEKQKLVELANHYDVTLIEDDVYSELYFGDDKPKPLKFWDTEDRVLTCGSFSKSLCPGYRIGWVVNGQYSKQLQKQQLISTLSGSSPVQQGIAHYLQFESYDNHLRKLRKLMQQRQQEYLTYIRETFPPQCTVNDPHGGYFLWLQLAKNIDSYELYEHLQKNGVSIGYGRLFSSQQQYQHCIRLNVSFAFEPEIRMALNQISKWLSKKEIT